jgi:hypothetical protein
MLVHHQDQRLPTAWNASPQKYAGLPTVHGLPAEWIDEPAYCPSEK